VGAGTAGTSATCRIWPPASTCTAAGMPCSNHPALCPPPPPPPPPSLPPSPLLSLSLMSPPAAPGSRTG
jgi:hypothetical protein